MVLIINMNILITGGKGYLGSKLVLALKDHEVEIFDKPKDILNKDELEEAIEGKDIVYHLAALAELSYTDEHPDETYLTNIEGTNNICKICADQNVLLNFISTSCIYGEPLELPSREDGLINPTDTYAMSKAAGEYLVKMWHLSRGLRYNILRLGTIYGQSIDREMRGDMCIQKFLEATIKGEPLIIKGTGQQNRNFIYIDDLVKGMVSVIGIKNQTINLAGKERITIKDVASMAMRLGKSKEIIYKPERKDDFRNQDVSIWKAKQLLGWQPEIRFSDGIKQFYKWLCSQ